ncbi:SAM-dependent methyltransferase [archaeon]|nr:SAM-dependent methyltransferase [archaeon]
MFNEIQKNLYGKSIKTRKGKLPRPRKTEVNAYIYIRDELRNLGWNTRNPERDADGQMYTQNECLENEEIQKYLEQKQPEAVIKVTDTKFWVIESKKEQKQIDQALEEARDYYAKEINKSKIIKAVFVSGIAGNDYDGYVIKTEYFDGKNFKPITINKKEISGLLIPEEVNLVIQNNNPNIEELSFDKKYQRLFLQKAQKVNAILHKGAITHQKRASVLASLLLSLLDENPLNVDLSRTPSVLIKEINARVEHILEEQEKPEFYKIIKLNLPSKSDNHVKFRKALVDTIQELRSINIRSALDSGTDILGKFYEVFLKYGNGAKEIGIVLTPRHITKFAVEVMNIGLKDIVYDPACGTGGFLVSSFDYIKKNATQNQIDNFKRNNLFGMEQDDDVVALAIVNMIFRGDGKNNIRNGDCFKNHLIKDGLTAKYLKNKELKELKEKDLEIEKVITKVLMNPPFALKDESEKAYRFVDYALEEMEDNGLLFAILPYSNLVKTGSFLRWREKILKKNTLLSVITFPNDLFYPIGVHSVGIFIKKGVAHPKEQNVLWIRALNDGYVKSKGKRLPNEKVKNNFEEIEDLVKTFLINPKVYVPNIKQFQKSCPIDYNDDILELVPENYLNEKKPTEEDLIKGLDNTLRNFISYLVVSDKEKEFQKNILSKDLFKDKILVEKSKLKEIPISDLFKTPIDTGYFHVSGILDNGKIPLISCSSLNGGVEAYVNTPDIKKGNVRGKEKIIQLTYKNAITIASDGLPLSSFYHYYKFCAKDNVLICFPKEDYKFTTLIYILTELERLKWRFSYGRKAYKNKIDKIKTFIPIKDNKIDEDYIEYLVKSISSWSILEKLFKA